MEEHRVEVFESGMLRKVLCIRGGVNRRLEGIAW
jgi:hypothetical protein